MNIAVNTRLLLTDHLEGIGRFAFESLKELVVLRPNDTFYFFFDRKFDSKYVFANNIVPVIIYPQARHAYLWEIWFNWMLPHYFKKHKIDIFFSPELYLSEKTEIPQIPVFHDINFLHNSEMIKGKSGKYLKSKTPKFAKKATKILTVSEFSALDISKTLNIDSKKINVCYNGINNAFNVKNIGKSPEEKPFFLIFGALNPRKNIINQLKAFDAYKAKTKNPDKLIIIGKKMNWTTEMEATLQSIKHKNEVVFLGRQSDETVCQYMHHAQALLFVSLFEGFGLPIIEAQKAGCPVITSNTSCLPEISGKNAIQISPNNISEITNAMCNIVDDKTWRKQQIEWGFENAKRFDWKQTASVINQTINEILC